MVQAFGYALTKRDGGDLRGILINLGGVLSASALSFRLTIKRPRNSPAVLSSVDACGQILGGSCWL